MSLDRITSQTAENPKIVIIWMHGLGADGNDFAPVVPEFNIKDLPIKFIFPHAPMIPVTINGGMTMRAWYDILAMDINRHIDEEGINASEKLIHEIIEEQVQLGFSYDHIILAGFSQGAAMSLQVSSRFQHKLAGIIALSGYLPFPEQTDKNSANISTPIFMGHGTQDPVVPFELGKASKDKLISSGYQVDWHQYPIQHGVCMEELEDIKQWLIKKIKA
ncbi:MAG: alpha/beta hydrolase [Marinicellaceae bacterium]